MKYLMFLFLSSCTSMIYGKEIQQEDCVASHIKALSDNQNLDGKFYEKVVDACRHIYTGRR